MEEKKSIRDVAKVLSKLSHPLRLELVLRLLENKCCVKEIGEILQLPQATASQHLKQLRESGIVEDNRKGNIVEYCITDPWILDFLTDLKSKIKSFS
jgi:ArsR family transcriptional regulator